MRTSRLAIWSVILTLSAGATTVALAGGDPASRDPRAGERSEQARERARTPRMEGLAERARTRVGPPADTMPPGSEGERPGDVVAERKASDLDERPAGAELRRLTPALRALMGPRSAASPTGGPPELVDIELIVPPPDAPAVEERLAAAGARGVRTAGVRMWASLPVANLSVLEEITPARRIGLRSERGRPLREARRVAEPRLMVGDVLSEGVPLVGAPVWQSFDSAGQGLLRGESVSIAVLDIGFLGFEDLLTVELPPAAHVFTLETAALWDIEGCLPPGSDDCVASGTALAEIVTDMLPRAELHLISIDPDDPISYQEAVDYLVQQNIDIAVNASIWAPGLHGDGWGTGPYNTEAARAVDNGVTWVNDIGDLDYLSFLLYGFNEAFPERGHWMGRFVDEVDQFTRGTFENDTYMDVWFDDQEATPENSTWLNRFCLGPNEYIFLDLIWDNWVDDDGDGVPEAGQDYRLDIWQFNENDTLVKYDDSTGGGNPDDPNFQNGEEGDYPWDLFGVVNDSAQSQCYYMSIFGEFIRPDSDNRFHLFWVADEDIDDDQLASELSEGFEPPGSIPAGTRMIPSDTAGVVGVGTSSLADVPEPFNPQGILEEETPRVCAPANVSTASFPFGGFLSSFSAAHAGGAIGLLMDRVGFLSAEDAVTILESRGRDITGEAPDTVCGYGRLCTLTTGCAPQLANP
jgi:hypothetical protein